MALNPTDFVTGESVTTQRYVERRVWHVCVRRAMELLRLDSAPDAVATRERFVQIPVSFLLVEDDQGCLRYPRPVHSKRCNQRATLDVRDLLTYSHRLQHNNGVDAIPIDHHNVPVFP